MASLTIRKAQDKDYEFFSFLYVVDVFQVLYKGTGREKYNPDEFAKLAFNLCADIDMINSQLHTCTVETFRAWKKTTYIIMYNGLCSCGYITYTKEKKKAKINDITILYDGLFSNGNFAAIMDEFREKENVDYINAYVSRNPNTEKMMEGAGFRRDTSKPWEMFWERT